jgi:hypothetical protein
VTEVRDKEKQCEGKKPLRTEGFASVLAASLGANVSAYRCPWCGAYHVGHTPKKRKQKGAE